MKQSWRRALFFYCDRIPAFGKSDPRSTRILSFLGTSVDGSELAYGSARKTDLHFRRKELQDGRNSSDQMAGVD